MPSRPRPLLITCVMAKGLSDEQLEPRTSTEAEEIHARVLNAIGPGTDPVTEGRRRIVQRHARASAGAGGWAVMCGHCTGYGDTPTAWPCADYRDAATSADYAFAAARVLKG